MRRPSLKLSLILVLAFAAGGTLSAQNAAGDNGAGDNGAGEIGECIGACEQAYQEALDSCFAPGDEDGDGVPNDFDPECLFEADMAFKRCMNSCLEDDPQFACVQDCEKAYFEALNECGVPVPGDPAGMVDIDDACAEKVHRAFDACLEECGFDPEPPPPPPAPPCFIECEESYQQAIQECFSGAEDAAIPGVPDPECVMRVEEAFNSCLLGCDDGIGEPVSCIVSCDQSFEESVQACTTAEGTVDEECLRAAEERLGQCLSECGLDVPPPDPCVSECDSSYVSAIEACHGTDGNVDVECLLAADQAFWACLETCGVEIPEVPEIPEEPCVIDCDTSFQAEIEACISAETGELDPECLVNADRNYLACLEGCGVPLPEPPDVPPGTQCFDECAGEIFEQFLACLVPENGELDTDCVLALEESLQACLESCEGEGEDRALGAGLRAERDPGAEFFRGDSNQDQRVDLSDAVFVLAELFLGGPPSVCQDASDANDDGQLNISDPVTILGSLFLGSGPLPPPYADAGRDPTADDLGCSSA